MAGKSGIELAYLVLDETEVEYERQKKINKAQVDTLIPLSKALYCEVRDLLEPLEQATAEER